MDISSFTQIDTFHWVLDMNTFVGESYHQIDDMCIFLLNNFTLPPIRLWSSTSSPLLTAPDAPSPSAKIGVSVEDLAALSSLNVAAEKKIERLTLKVGKNLFNFMQSFCRVDGSKLVVPMDILDRWFKKFQEKAKRDPEYFKGFAL
ncbi:hypothetical protein V6N13_114933 [Hibiscus sabdariffa]|uniref:Hikeshi-like C-terminal domain-containing protein n=1 Tax=Hibiscus sabdariffa TaxID=183260 RepID=A0ABR2U426_9ROSI